MEKRTSKTTLDVRQEQEHPIITARFIVFDSPTELFEGYFEQVDSEAVQIDGDVVALFDHDTSKVLGRTITKTLVLRKEKDGVYGDIVINEKDTEAMNIYERVKRGDVCNCSFGFYIKDYKEERNDDKTVTVTLLKVELLEVSIVTFPAYDNTEAKARFKLSQQKAFNLKKERAKEKIQYVKSIEISKTN